MRNPGCRSDCVHYRTSDIIIKLNATRVAGQSLHQELSKHAINARREHRRTPPTHRRKSNAAVTRYTRSLAELIQSIRSLYECCSDEHAGRAAHLSLTKTLVAEQLAQV